MNIIAQYNKGKYEQNDESLIYISALEIRSIVRRGVYRPRLAVFGFNPPPSRSKTVGSFESPSA
jgi:hypothetical protein